MKKNVLNAEFAVIVPSYNNAKWCQKNLASIASQTYPLFHLYYINDASTDETKELATECIASSSLKDKTTFIDNKERKGSLTNFYEIIQTLEPNKIVVCVDGDDWLSNQTVLDHIASLYSDKNVWLTYGDYEIEPKDGGVEGHCEPIPEEVLAANSIRTHSFVSSHLKTFYAKLFQKIKKEDLMIDGRFFPISGDLAFMTPMLEMASKNHIRYVSRVLYIYNTANPLNDFRGNLDDHKLYKWIIRVREPYKPLDLLF